MQDKEDHIAGLTAELGTTQARLKDKEDELTKLTGEYEQAEKEMMDLSGKIRDAEGRVQVSRAHPPPPIAPQNSLPAPVGNCS